MGRAVPCGIVGVVQATAVCLVVAGSVGAADLEAVGSAMSEMLTAARAMVDSGNRRDFGGLITEANRVVDAGARALAALPQPGNRHARDAADHVRQAMNHAKLAAEAARRGKEEDALAYARQSFSQARRGAGHAEAL